MFGDYGEFVEAGEHRGRPFYKQRDTEGYYDEDFFLYQYSDGGLWWAGDILRGSAVYQQNNQSTTLPMTSDWLYWIEQYDEGIPINDTSLTVEFTSLSPCNLVRVAGDEDVVRMYGDSLLGDYRSAFIIVII